MTTICEGRVVGDESSPTLLRVRLLRDGSTIAEHDGDARFTIEDDEGVRLRVSSRGAEILGAERVSGKWSELKESPHAELVAKSAPGPHLTVELEVAVVREGDRVAVAVDEIDESLRPGDYRGEGAKVDRAARAKAVALGKNGRAMLEKRAAASEKKTEKKEKSGEVRTSRGIWRFYLGYPVLALASLLLGYVPDAARGWEHVLGLTLAIFFFGLTLVDVSGVHFPPRFRVGGDAGTKTEKGFWRGGRLRSTMPWSMRWYLWPYVLVQPIALLFSLGAYEIAGTSANVGLTMQALFTLLVGIGLLFRASRFVRTARLMLSAPPARGDQSSDLAAVEGSAQGSDPIRRLASAFYLMPVQKHSGGSENVLTVKNEYDHAKRFEIQRTDGSTISVESAEGALWTSLARSVIDDSLGQRTLTETIAYDAPVLVVGPYEGGAIVGRGPESVFVFGSNGGDARAALRAAIMKTLAPGACAILLALASLALAFVFHVE